MDRKEFSYVAGDFTSGIYVNFIVACAPEAIAVLQAKFKLDEVVYRLHVQKLKAKVVAAEA